MEISVIEKLLITDAFVAVPTNSRRFMVMPLVLLPKAGALGRTTDETDTGAPLLERDWGRETLDLLDFMWFVLDTRTTTGTVHPALP